MRTRVCHLHVCVRVFTSLQRITDKKISHGSGVYQPISPTVAYNVQPLPDCLSALLPACLPSPALSSSASVK